MTSNRTLSIHQPEDILGYIPPHMLGYWPEDSLVAITMQGRSLAPHCGWTCRTLIHHKPARVSRTRSAIS